MTDTTTYQQLRRAREHLRAGEWAQARALLRRLDHPQAQALLDDLNAKHPPPRRFPLFGVIGLIVGVLVFVAGGLWAATRAPAAAPPEDVPLPTLAVFPTDDCTPDSVHAWWGTHNAAVDAVVAGVSLASRTMPGERLTSEIADLRQLRGAMTAPPECATAAVNAAAGELAAGMDAALVILDAWSGGDAELVSTELPGIQAEIQAARNAVRRALP